MLTVLAVFTLVLWVFLTTDWFLGVRKVAKLSEAHGELDEYPLLSVVIPALNEADTVEEGLRSVLTQAYPNLEVLVLNDRSTDRTGEILERLREVYPQLHVIHIKELPSGWLGKNHALHVGARRARGDWLLFADADVQFGPGALLTAVSYAVRRDLDHLTAVPQMVSKSPWLKSFVSAFMLLFSFGVLRASAPATKAYVGLGAFNLLRRSVYEHIGGHGPIALRPDDDMMLGKLVKGADFKQEVVLATELLRVEWYKSVREAIRGLNKNAFAGLFYSVPAVLLVTFALALTHVLPFVAVFTATGLPQFLYALVLANIVFVYALAGQFMRLPFWCAALHPVGTALLIYAILESAAKATWRGGINWRGTFYPLEQLKNNKV